MFKDKLLTVVNAVATLSDVASLPSEFEVELAKEKELSYNEGFAAGGAVNPEGKIYSQADMDVVVEAHKVALAIALEEGEVKADKRAVEAVNEFKAAFLAELDAAQASENAIELDIRSKLL